MFRQGDIPLVPVPGERLPEHARPLPRDAQGRLVLALGEATGHAHAVAAPTPTCSPSPTGSTSGSCASSPRPC